MISMTTTKILSRFFTLLFVLAICIPAISLAEESKKDSATVTVAEKQEAMAKMHEEMAKCLREGKDPKDCRSETMANCPMMQNGTCPMMEEMMGGGMMGGHHMNKRAAAKTKSKDNTSASKQKE
ncbi:MAG: hypothetical protein AB7H97_22295 [Pseudobdellovibrionaceae bacterium]